MYHPARGDTGTIHISFIKTGFVIDGAVGSDTLTFRGRNYPPMIYEPPKVKP